MTMRKRQHRIWISCAALVALMFRAVDSFSTTTKINGHDRQGLLARTRIRLVDHQRQPMKFQNEGKRDVSQLDLFPSPHDFLHHLPSMSISSASPLPDLDQVVKDTVNQLPFADFSRRLFDELDIGSALNIDARSVDDEATGMVLESIGQDLLLFLAASVLVTPLSNTLNTSPILGFLLAGAVLGPHGLDVFANSKADVELGDFGILFLLFSEGLQVSTSRLKQLANFLPLGLAQISLCAGALSAGIVLVAPALERFLPLDAGLVDIRSPAEALVLALAGTLSTSAFVFPVLKEREWEEEQSGQAATSILLLQDLAVAPLLVLMPFVVGQGPTDYGAIGFLTAKATIGFGGVIYVGSLVLRQFFDLIATTRSTETFVALCLLVSVGIGEIAKGLGLTDTAGAFAAGLLLSNTNYRAQIQADILPFKGILLGIFFMTAGSEFDTETFINEFPTVMTGALALILFKATTIFLATRVPEFLERNRLPVADGIRLALLLAGGGEFAFVVLALAEKLEVLPAELGSLLTAIVLITMAVTPFLGELAEFASKPFLDTNSGSKEQLDKVQGTTMVDPNSIVVCGYADIGKACLLALSEENKWLRASSEPTTQSDLPNLVAFDSDPSLAGNILIPLEDTVVLYGDGSNPEVIRSAGIEEPRAIFVSYEDSSRVAGATTRLRASFPDTAIFTRAPTRGEAETLKDLGATEVVIEADELPRSTPALLWWSAASNSNNAMTGDDDLSRQRMRQVLATASGVSLETTDSLLELYQCMDQDLSGNITAEEIADLIFKSNAGLHTDAEIAEMTVWIRETVVQPLDMIGFVRFYATSSPMIKQAMTDACLF